MFLSKFFGSNAQFHSNKNWEIAQKTCSNAENHAQTYLEQMKWTELNLLKITKMLAEIAAIQVPMSNGIDFSLPEQFLPPFLKNFTLPKLYTPSGL